MLGYFVDWASHCGLVGWVVFSIYFFDPERNVAVNAELGIFMVFLRDGRFCLFAYFPGLICSYQHFLKGLNTSISLVAPCACSRPSKNFK